MVIFTAACQPTYADTPVGVDWDFRDGGTTSGNPAYYHPGGALPQALAVLRGNPLP